ncbi:hypothetical protein Lal_00018587 [Lupinus albus]|nr:hypothetical protein Lal_00018587 [Lupinus albus]
MVSRYLSLLLLLLLFVGDELQVLSFTVEVELPVYNAILKFQKDKQPGDDLFDMLDTSKLNAHLKEHIQCLNKDTKDGDAAEKIVVYNHANKQAVLKELKIDLDRARKGKPPLKSSDGKTKRNLTPEALEKKVAQTNTKIEKMQRDMMTKEDLKTVALGTSKINYLDPRITVAWCKRHEVPIEKIFNKSLLAKFAWAMDVDPDFRF